MIERIWLWRMGRNLNRCVRTAHSFGVKQVITVECVGQIEGNLYSASATELVEAAALPNNAIAFEVDGGIDIADQSFCAVTDIIIGGESVTLPRNIRTRSRVQVPTENALCLTSEAALSIALYAAMRNHTAPLRHYGWGCWASPLPSRQILSAASAKGVKAVIDMTQRDRSDVRRWCDQTGIGYCKLPVAYDGDVTPAIELAQSLEGDFLAHCFHGRDRTGRFLAAWRLAHETDR